MLSDKMLSPLDSEPPTSSPDPHEHSRTSKRLLVVEDDYEVRSALTEVLASEDYAVCEAENGRQALELLRSGYRPDLMLLDLMMPVMTGVQLLEVMQHDARLQTIPVVVLSASVKEHELRGARAVLSKPLGLEQLLETVLQVAP